MSHENEALCPSCQDRYHRSEAARAEGKRAAQEAIAKRKAARLTILRHSLQACSQHGGIYRTDDAKTE